MSKRTYYRSRQSDRLVQQEETGIYYWTSSRTTTTKSPPSRRRPGGHDPAGGVRVTNYYQSPSGTLYRLLDTYRGMR